MLNNQDNSRIKDDEKFNQVFKILADVIAPELDSENQVKRDFLQTSKIIINFWKKAIITVLKEADWWEKIFFIGSGFLTLLCFVLAIIVSIIKNANEVPDRHFILFALICTLLIMPFWLSFIALNTRRTWESPSLHTRNKLKKAIDEAKGDRTTIEELCRKSDKQTIKSIETQIKFLVELVQVQEKRNFNFLPLLALGSVVFVIYILGIPVQSLESSKPLYGAVAGLPGIVALTLLIFKLPIESSLQSQIIKYKRCLSLLERARNLLEDVGENEI